MEFSYAYHGQSNVQNSAGRTSVSFSPDTSRSPTFFRGVLHKAVPFREAISALHNVVISDLRFKPKDRSEYLRWVAEQGDLIDWSEVGNQRANTQAKIKQLQEELQRLNQRRSARWAAYYTAQQRYYQYLYEKERDVWFVLDPVITIHPDEVFFECFSEDESTYGRLGVDLNVFKDVKDFSCGTTNIDYSSALYDEFQKIRSYKETRLEIDPSGFSMQQGSDPDYKEVKIDLPDSWVRGFLQVSSAMSMPTTQFELHPMDLYNVCLALRRKKEKEGPRSLRYRLKPGQPVTIILDPWNLEIPCPRSVYLGDKEEEIRVWGRRRLLILERLIPLARRFTVHLLGYGMPSFYVADLGDMSFTLGLSGWTANDWSKEGNFDLMAPRSRVDAYTSQNIYAALRKDWRQTPDALASSLGLDRASVLGALSAWTQAGRAIYDLNKGLYRARELSRDPLPIDKLRFSSDREESASKLVDQRAVTLATPRRDVSGNLHLSGTVRETSHVYAPFLTIDRDERLSEGECSCAWFQHNKLRKGPCPHLLALRIQNSRS